MAFLDFENHFNAIGLECLFEILEKFGMAKEDVGVLKQYYEHSYFQVAQETRMPPFAHTRGGGRERADQVAGKRRWRVQADEASKISCTTKWSMLHELS